MEFIRAKCLFPPLSGNGLPQRHRVLLLSRLAANPIGSEAEATGNAST
jgi:hypothetical protein